MPLLKQPDELTGFIACCTARLDQAAKLPAAPDTKLYRLTLEKKATTDQRRSHQGGGRRPPVAGR